MATADAALVGGFFDHSDHLEIAVVSVDRMGWPWCTSGMAKGFLPYEVDQRLLLPPDLREWLPEGHLALFVLDLVQC